MELNYNTAACRVRGCNLSHVAILYLTHIQATLVRASQYKQTIFAFVLCLTAWCSLANRIDSIMCCVVFFFRLSHFCMRGQNGCGDGRGKYFSHCFTMSQLWLQIRLNIFGRLTGNSVQSVVLKQQCWRAWWIVCVCSGPQKARLVCDSFEGFYILLQSMQSWIHLRLTQWQDWPTQ